MTAPSTTPEEPPRPTTNNPSIPSQMHGINFTQRRNLTRDRRRRRIELEQTAASRTYNGNGMSGNLPPLPTTDDNSDDDDEADNDSCDDMKNRAAGGGGGGGCSTLFGHPYGALPYGNIHLAACPPISATTTTSSNTSSQWQPDIVRHSGLGPYFRILNDEQLLTILSYIDGPTLATGVIPASRFMYVAGHHEELWRDLVLRASWGEEEGFMVPSPTNTKVSSTTVRDGKASAGATSSIGRKRKVGCWKDIYAYNYHHRHYHDDDKSRLLPQHNPISISGIYSDTFFRSWLCRSFALQPSWLSTHTVPTLPHNTITTETFLDYEERNIPLLIQGASTTWAASHKWKQPNYLIDTCQTTKFRATSGAAPLPTSFTMQNYINYCASSTEESPLYLFDRSFGYKVPQLLDDFECDLKRTCPWWDVNSAHGHDLFSVLGEERRPDHQWLIVGPKRSGSCFHIDPNCTHAWNAPILGRKRWIFYPPGVTPPGIFPSPNGDDVCMPISIGEWFLTYWNEHVERRMDPDVSKRPMECTACPGDVLFVPHGWWHMVLNIGNEDEEEDDSNDESDGKKLNDPLRGVSIALTRNYVSASNLPDLLRFLDTKVSQVSGCRDRKEAVRPEELGREFRTALMAVGGIGGNGGGIDSEQVQVSFDEKKCDDNDDKLPEEEVSRKGRWVDLLERSELRANDGWSCKAWTDAASLSTCANDGDGCVAMANKRTKKRRIGSSILTKAKQPQTVTTCDAAANSLGSDDVSNRFSFSFFS